MLPTLKPGQIVLGWRWLHSLEPGDVVIFRHNGLDKIKRVVRISPNELYVMGDNPQASTDSSSFGWIDNQLVLGKLFGRRRRRWIRATM